MEGLSRQNEAFGREAMSLSFQQVGASHRKIPLKLEGVMSGNQLGLKVDFIGYLGKGTN